MHCACGCGQQTPIAKKTAAREGAVKGQPRRFLRGHHIAPRGEANARWAGGRKTIGRGYVGVLRPGHPRATPSGYVPEHVLVVEAALGKLLDRRHSVHHLDENRRNNANSNLVACEDAAYHQLLHRRARALEACGDANAVQCCICGGYGRQDDITVTTSDRRGYQRAYHRTCAAQRERIRGAARAEEN